MRTLTLALSLAGIALGATTGAFAAVTSNSPVSASNIVLAQEDCKDGEKWNDETKKCEADAGGDAGGAGGN